MATTYLTEDKENSAIGTKYASISDEIRDIYFDVIGSRNLPFDVSDTFPVLGGNSLTAIYASHRIMAKMKIMGFSLDEDCVITPSDVLHHSVEEICSILQKGRKTSNIQLSANKRLRADSVDIKASILSTAGLSCAVIELAPKHSVVKSIEAAWKCQLLMCVDAPPLVVTVRSHSVLFIGSQGGDIAVIHENCGRVIYRAVLKGKIEGAFCHQEVTHQDIIRRHIVFVNSYRSSSPTPDSSGATTCALGKSSTYSYVHAFELKVMSNETNFAPSKSFTGTPEFEVVPLWKCAIIGELKSEPLPFNLITEKQGEMRYGILVGSYNGTATSIDSLTGKIIAEYKNLGGAIHSKPVIVWKERDQVWALLVSCGWRGRLSCLRIAEASIFPIWHVDLWSPVYSIPLLVTLSDLGSRDNQFAVIGGIDGCMRCINAGDGEVLWKAHICNGRPIFSSCASVSLNGSIHAVFGANDGYVRCIHLHDGFVKWIFNAQSTILGKPAISISGGQIVVATVSGTIFLLDSATGRELKRSEDRLNAEIFSSPVIVDDTSSQAIYIGCRDSCLYKFWY